MPKWRRFRLPGQPTHPSDTSIIDAYNEGGFFGEGGVVDTIGDNITEAVQTADILIDNARAKLQDPLETIERVAAKAIPASLAACASLQYTGGQGSFANFLQPIMLTAKFFITDPQRIAYVGRPYHQVSQLSVLSGYVKCRHVIFDVGASTGAGPTLEEQQIIKAYLESGCFIE